MVFLFCFMHKIQQVKKMQFSRYHGCENSFLITTYEPNKNYSLIAKDLCRGTNYNADGLLVVKVDPLEVLIFNRDGSEASMCGNGLRTVVHYCYNKYKIYQCQKIKTKAGYYDCEINSLIPFVVTVNLGLPTYINNIVKKSIIINNSLFEISTILLGVLHTVVIVNDFDNLEELKDNLFAKQLFKYRCNVDFVKIKNHHTIEIRTFENGVGWTKSCGTGAAASAYVLSENYNLSNRINVITLGGILQVKITDSIYLTGTSEMIDEFEVIL